jgi:hypothetical protein
MPTYYVRNDVVRNGLGYAVPNVAVTYYTQPGLAPASVFGGPSGGVIANPQFTNGLGQATAYLAPGFYTITYSGAQVQTLTLQDQEVGDAGSGGSTITTFAGVPTGTINGTNQIFTFPVPVQPSYLEVALNFPLISGVGYTSSWVSGTLTIVYTTAPQSGDNIYVQGFYET